MEKDLALAATFFRIALDAAIRSAMIVIVIVVVIVQRSSEN